MTHHVIETVTFKLTEGADAQSFVNAAKGMATWLKSQPGFVRRRLSCAEDGTWIEHIEWADMDAAKAAAAAVGTAPDNAAVLGAIDGPSVSMMHSVLEVSLD